MLQLKDPPYSVVELWWESEGKFRFSYDALGEDVMCAWPHGGTSNNSAWELEELRQELTEQRGLGEPMNLPARLGTWSLDRNASVMLLTNHYQPDNMIFLTHAGFIFFDAIGGALRVEGGRLPQHMTAREAAPFVALLPQATCPPPSEQGCIDWPPTSERPVLDKIYSDFEEKYGAMLAALGQPGEDRCEQGEDRGGGRGGGGGLAG